ncbi:MAG: hypothetical protein OHK93_005032 [Ramalina farinacea]|uniref:Uncharacterized protein n=1 Tax=Ramalina farinacea TaxID=258253 RepID=A0AA43TZA0_9LECA|nr:hypothetical protein [Ramalina farinacea]
MQRLLAKELDKLGRTGAKVMERKDLYQSRSNKFDQRVEGIHIPEGSDAIGPGSGQDDDIRSTNLNSLFDLAIGITMLKDALITTSVVQEMDGIKLKPQERWFKNALRNPQKYSNVRMATDISSGGLHYECGHNLQRIGVNRSALDDGDWDHGTIKLDSQTDEGFVCEVVSEKATTNTKTQLVRHQRIDLLRPILRHKRDQDP